MSHLHRLSNITLGLCFIGVSLVSSTPPSNAYEPSAEQQCYRRATSIGSGQRSRRRAAYLCEGARSIAPAKCYWAALSFGASHRTRDRAARLCRGAESTQPAKCYWKSIGYFASRRSQRYAVKQCMAKPPITIPVELEDCMLTYQRRLGVSADSALDICSRRLGF